MKFHNRQKRYRNAQWITVQAPNIHFITDARDWCKQQSSDGKFYYHYSNTKWWFENSEDALAFKLRWVCGAK